MARAPIVSSHVYSALERFELVSTGSDHDAVPADVSWEGALQLGCPGTVAQALDRVGKLAWSTPPELDGQDHWLRCRLPDLLPPGDQVLVFEGLATFAEVWLDGERVLSTSNMFVTHSVDVTACLRAGSELTLCFRSLASRLAARRPRPRWRTRIVEQQQLRWVRTSLIGRTPGFCPRIVPVGPYREARLESRPDLHLNAASLRTRIEDEKGLVELDLTLSAVGTRPLPARATLRIEGAAGAAELTLNSQVEADKARFHGSVRLDSIALWWPHTHGEQPRSRCTLVLDGGVEIELGQVAFRSLRADLDCDGRGFGIVINDTPVFCRGACWTTDDVLSLGADSDKLRATLLLVRAAGMNMLRIGGTTSYESDAFYELCDELGILVFQDFMFANMDYPVADAEFRSQVEQEAREVLRRIGARPSLTVLCGGSEVAQQAAMLGMPRELWTGPLFDELLPAISRDLAPGIPYFPSSPWGGELPFYVNEGIGHYYGVGAYLRPLEDARRADVRFATECLAFANVPERATLEGFLGDLEMPQHHPRWKERVPRDRGAAWDFEDVRDHYVRTLFAVDPHTLRYSDPERYLALGRAAVAEVMEATFAEWRREGSRCRGALVFWLKDFWEGAGWGVIDSRGLPKSAYYGLARALQPVSLHCTDEGVNGIVLHAINESALPITANLRVTLYREGEVVVAQADHPLTLLARSVSAHPVERLLGRFADSGFSYRFGPAGHDLIAASLASADHVLARAFHLPLGRGRAVEPDLGLTAVAATQAGRPGIHVSTRRFAQHVCLDVDDHTPRDSGFHLEPGSTRWIELVPRTNKAVEVRGSVTALNTSNTTRIASEPKR